MNSPCDDCRRDCEVPCWKVDHGLLVEVVHARWRHLCGDEGRCTNCGNVIHTEGSWERPEQKYCDDCGAKMDGGTP